MVATNDDDQFVASYQPVVQPGRRIWALDETEINLSPGHQGHHPLAVDRGHGELGWGLSTGELGCAHRNQLAGQQVLGDRQAGRDPKVSTPARTQRRDARIKVRGLLQDSICPLDEQVASRGEF